MIDCDMLKMYTIIPKAIEKTKIIAIKTTKEIKWNPKKCFVNTKDSKRQKETKKIMT